MLAASLSVCDPIWILPYHRPQSWTIAWNAHLDGLLILFAPLSVGPFTTIGVHVAAPMRFKSLRSWLSNMNG
jgi:hypothetical protein